MLYSSTPLDYYCSAILNADKFFEYLNHFSCLLHGVLDTVEEAGVDGKEGSERVGRLGPVPAQS